MKHTQEEIINALKVIKDECGQYEECENCPFYNEKIYCAIRDPDENPSQWDIAEETEVWRAFK